MSRPYRSKEQARTYWQEVLKRWRQSGLSAPQFCRIYQIANSGFYTWRKKLAVTQATPEPQSSNVDESPFVQVEMHPTPHSQLTLQLTSGHTLHIAHPVDTDALVKVIHALQEANLC